jgi:hypothetical protein
VATCGSSATGTLPRCNSRRVEDAFIERARVLSGCNSPKTARWRPRRHRQPLVASSPGNRAGASVTGEQRRLAAIVAADVVGYSRLMGRDEAGTLAALKAIRREVVDPAISRHNGRIVKTTGDGNRVTPRVWCESPVWAKSGLRDKKQSDMEPCFLLRIRQAARGSRDRRPPAGCARSCSTTPRAGCRCWPR